MTIENPTPVNGEGKSTCLKRNKSKSTKTNNEIIDYQLVIKTVARRPLDRGSYSHHPVAVEPAGIGGGDPNVAG